MHYVLELGRNIELSVAEIVSVFGVDSLVSLHSQYLIVDVDDSVDVNKLGGVISVHKVEGVFEGFLDDKDLIKIVVNNVSAKNVGMTSNFLSHKIVDNVLRKSKKILKSKGQSVRFLLNTKTATVLGAGFNKGKVNVFGLFRFDGKIYLTTLQGVQNIDAYSGRDFKKPYRDAKLGMLPPKLALIMINLAGEGKVYDPFCGTGTVLMEGLVQGRDVVGSDLQDVNIDGTYKNLEWLVDRFDLDVDSKDIDVFQADARKISRDDFEVVVTEGYLGAPKKGNESLIELKAEMLEIEQLYLGFLESLAKSSTHEFTLVMSVPVFSAGSKRVYAEKLVEKLEPLGYSVSALIPSGNNLELESQETFLYKRKDQKVFRKILRLQYIPR